MCRKVESVDVAVEVLVKNDAEKVPSPAHNVSKVESERNVTCDFGVFVCES